VLYYTKPVVKTAAEDVNLSEISCSVIKSVPGTVLGFYVDGKTAARFVSLSQEELPGSLACARDSC
jgi:hypothetical protein